jgi:hypothetical protein
MPLRIDAPQTHAWRGRHIAAALAVGAAALIAAQHFASAPPHEQEAQAQPVQPVSPAAAPASKPRWTIVYERPNACDAGCSHVLDTLNAVSRDPASGIPDGDAQVVVRSAAQPARDLIVLDPEGEPAGFISHTDDPGRIVSGLATLRASTAAATPIASR